MYLSPGKCREIGVFLLACAFHGPAEGVPPHLSHPESDIRSIIIPAGRLTLEDLPVGLSMVFFALNHHPVETQRHPWLYHCGTRSLPQLELSNADDSIVTDEKWSGRDTVRIWASNAGSLELAELMPNAGCSWNEVREYALEGDANHSGVPPRIYDGEDVPMDSSSGSGKQEYESYPATLDIPAEAFG